MAKKHQYKLGQEVIDNEDEKCIGIIHSRLPTSFHNPEPSYVVDWYGSNYTVEEEQHLSLTNQGQ